MFEFLKKYPKDATTNDLSDIDYISLLILTGNISQSEVIGLAIDQGDRLELGDGFVVKKNPIGNWEVEFNGDCGRDSMGLQLFLTIGKKHYGN